MLPQEPAKSTAPCSANTSPVHPALRAACARRVRIYRGLMRAGFTGEEASRLVGHVPSTLWKWEQGKIAVWRGSVPRIIRRLCRNRRRVERLEKVLARLGVSV